MPETTAQHQEGAFSHTSAICESCELEFRRLLDKLPAGAYTCNAEGLITYFNSHAVALWGRAPKLNDPVDRFCGSFKLFSIDGSPIQHDECWMALALRLDREFNGHEIIIERPDGQRLTALAHANPIRDDNGKLLGAVNVLVDITDRKRAEDSLKEADRAKNEFLATLAHELRNPLAPIRNAVAILHLKGSPTPELSWALEVIDRQMQQMTRLIDDLLDIARMTGNKLELRTQRVELSEVIRCATETSRPVIESYGHDFVSRIPAEPIYLNADLTRLAQVVSNLLNNSAKYTMPGGRIWLEVERQGSDAVIRVRDNGIGIPREMLPRVFEMFTQIDRVPGRVQGGLGIGLTLVKRLVELHGGSITAHSDGPGKGSEFVLRLPVVITPSQVVSPRMGMPTERIGSATALRILVVDDNRDSAGSLAMLLRILGNEIQTAHDGLAAVQLAEQFRPNVILLDIGLPKLSGYEAASTIRQQPWGKGIVLVAVTGWGQEADRNRSKEAGFNHHLVKPVDPAALIQLLAPLGQSVSGQGNASTAGQFDQPNLQHSFLTSPL